MKKKKAKKVDKQAMITYLKASRVERTRVIGDMFGYADTSETYQALSKRLDDLNATITQIQNDLQSIGVMA